MRSLQIKFSALLVLLLLVACTALTWLATRHERAALEAEVGARARALAENLARASKEPLVAGDALTLNVLVAGLGEQEGVVAARVFDRSGRLRAAAGSLAGSEVPGATPPPAGPSEGTRVERRGTLLVASRPLSLSGVPIGEAQVVLDLDVLVEPAVRRTTAQLAAVAAVVLVLGVASGLGFVALLVGPLRRLRAGVERLTRGDLAVRVPPTSRDEVGELTRAFNEMGEALQQKERIQSAFGRYVSGFVLDQLLETPEGGDLGGVEREVTLLFADIRRFTRLSEGMKARDVVALLNEVFELASECILRHGGTIDKFMGDSVMAYFGAPIPQPDHARRAVAAALDLRRAIARRNASAAGAGIPVELGFGIHTGTVVVGNIGSERRTDFTAVGDAVNVAHRLEKLARPGEILVSEAVQRRVRDAFRLRFEGERQLSGRQEPVHVYAVEETEGAAPPGAAAPSSP